MLSETASTYVNDKNNSSYLTVVDSPNETLTLLSEVNPEDQVD